MAGIIYVSDSELGWQPVVESWLQKLKESEAAALRPCFAKFVGHMLDFVRRASTVQALRWQGGHTHSTLSLTPSLTPGFDPDHSEPTARLYSASGRSSLLIIP